jgi:hypothetical protein
MEKKDMDEFELVKVVLPKAAMPAVTIMRDGRLRLNERFKRGIACDAFRIYMHKKNSNIRLEECEKGQNDAHYVKKDGTMQANGILNMCLKREIDLPARYTLEKDDHSSIWEGTIDLDYVPPKPKNNRRKLSKPRKSGLEDMLPDKRK